MQISEILTSLNLVLTSITLTVTYFNYRYYKKKDFQDKLYQIKLDAYKNINAQCYEACKWLDINSTPFVQVYDIGSKESWDEYFLKDVSPLYHIGFDLQKLVYQNTIFLPIKVVDKIYEFSNACLSYITMSAHYDTGLIISTQDKVWELFVELCNTIREDLKIESIDKGLSKRMTGKVL